MFVIQNNEPSSFFCSEPNLRIYDDRRNMFYVHPNTEQKINFNLPKGKYYTPNTITRNAEFKPYKTFKPFLPKGFLDDLEIEVGRNRNKASIIRHKKYILIDGKFAKHIFSPIPVFCLAHELHHFRYYPKDQTERNNERKMIEIEKKCDEGAVDYMLSKGYNPTQIKLAKNLILSNKERGACVDHLTTHKTNNFRR